MGSEWRRARLGDLARIEHGWPFQSELFSHELTGRPIVIGIGNFDYSGGFRFDSTVLKEYRGEYPTAFDLQPGDILLVMTCQTAGGEILGIPARVPDDGRHYLHIIALLSGVIRTGPGISGIRFTNNVINGTVVEDAYIYRLTSKASGATRQSRGAGQAGQ